MCGWYYPQYSHLDAFGWYHPTYFRDIGNPVSPSKLNNQQSQCLLLGYKILQSDPQSWLLGWFIVGLPHYWTLGQVWGISRIFCLFWNINPRSIVEYWELYQPNRMLGFDTNINIFLGVIFEYTTWYFGIFDIWRNLSIYCICEFNHLWEVIVGILTISTKCFNLPSISNILPEVI